MEPVQAFVLVLALKARALFPIRHVGGDDGAQAVLSFGESFFPIRAIGYSPSKIRKAHEHAPITRFFKGCGIGNRKHGFPFRRDPVA